MGSYEELDAALTRVANEMPGAVTDVVAVARGRSAGADRTPAEAIRVLDAWYLREAQSVERTMVYLLALAEMHGVTLDDPQRRKTLLVAVLLGDEGARIARSALTGSGATWARRMVSLPRVGNPLLGQLLNHAIDTGLSAAVAKGGDAVQARAVVTQARLAFGEPPATFPGQRPRTPPRTSGTGSGLGPSPTSAYARALARTIHKAKKGRQAD